MWLLWAGGMLGWWWSVLAAVWLAGQCCRKRKPMTPMGKPHGGGGPGRDGAAAGEAFPADAPEAKGRKEGETEEERTEAPGELPSALDLNLSFRGKSKPPAARTGAGNASVSGESVLSAISGMSTMSGVGGVGGVLHLTHAWALQPAPPDAGPTGPPDAGSRGPSFKPNNSKHRDLPTQDSLHQHIADLHKNA